MINNLNASYSHAACSNQSFQSVASTYPSSANKKSIATFVIFNANVWYAPLISIIGHRNLFLLLINPLEAHGYILQKCMMNCQ